MTATTKHRVSLITAFDEAEIETRMQEDLDLVLEHWFAEVASIKFSTTPFEDDEGASVEYAVLIVYRLTDKAEATS